jgi:hypothetical protein
MGAAVRYPFFIAVVEALAADLSHTLHMFHPFQQLNHLQTLDTIYATKYLGNEPQPGRSLTIHEP